MNAQPGAAVRQRLEILSREILIWNSRINLVTRQQTERKLATMLAHCLAAWELARQALGDHDWFATCPYVDIGSGAGLPGLVWASAREHLGHTGPVHLIEPRRRRAWFLQRAAGAMALQGVRVANQRWAEGLLSPPLPATIPALVSLKALKMDDRTILAGVAAPAYCVSPPPEVAILRFLPAAVQKATGRAPTDTEIADGVAAGDDGGPPAGPGYQRYEHHRLGIEAPRLALVRYEWAAAQAPGPGGPECNVPRGTFPPPLARGSGNREMP